MNKVVLDASALLALIFEEEGAETIKPFLKNAIMSTVNIAETLTILEKSNINTEESLKFIKSMLNEIVPFDTGHAKAASDMYCATKSIGLSLGDRACIALGIVMQVPIYTADKIWIKLELEDVEIRLIR